MTIHITVEERKGPFLTFAPIYKYSDIDFVDNKAQGQISKWVLQEKKARQIFWKTNISYPLIRKRTGAYQGVGNVRFSENLVCFGFL